MDAAGTPSGGPFYISEVEVPSNSLLLAQHPRVFWRGDLAAIVWESKNNPATLDSVVALRLSGGSQLQFRTDRDGTPAPQLVASPRRQRDFVRRDLAAGVDADPHATLLFDFAHAIARDLIHRRVASDGTTAGLSFHPKGGHALWRSRYLCAAHPAL